MSALDLKQFSFLHYIEQTNHTLTLRGYKMFMKIETKKKFAIKLGPVLFNRLQRLLVLGLTNASTCSNVLCFTQYLACVQRV